MSGRIQLWSQKYLVTEGMKVPSSPPSSLWMFFVIHPEFSLGSLHMSYCRWFTQHQVSTTLHFEHAYQIVVSHHSLEQWLPSPMEKAVDGSHGCHALVYLNCKGLELSPGIYLEDKRSFRASAEAMRDLRSPYYNIPFQNLGHISFEFQGLLPCMAMVVQLCFSELQAFRSLVMSL